MNDKGSVDSVEIRRMVFCLAATCLIASIILGLTYNFTEPVKRKYAVKHEQELVEKLLNLSTGSTVMEIRRYQTESSIGYWLPGQFVFYNMDGKLLKSIPVADENFKAAEQKEDWVLKNFAGGHFAGRFFVAKDAENRVQGYVTEAVQFGFKSPIRFFVALSPDFTIHDVEVVSHEEDPGLGAEITTPLFKNQFVGRKMETLASLEVVKGPIPKEVKNDGPIYAVTGATISSRALTDGVKRAVLHLQQRLKQVQP
ncbi:MAG: FMN-binding protein [Deltaproteobacteria bacterium]|nr:FMN-binding protein [Deltaproteobacteria bacterium]